MQGYEDFGSYVDFGTKRKYDPSKGMIDCTPTEENQNILKERDGIRRESSIFVWRRLG